MELSCRQLFQSFYALPLKPHILQYFGAQFYEAFTLSIRPGLHIQQTQNKTDSLLITRFLFHLEAHKISVFLMKRCKHLAARTAVCDWIMRRLQGNSECSEFLTSKPFHLQFLTLSLSFNHTERSERAHIL